MENVIISHFGNSYSARRFIALSYGLSEDFKPVFQVDSGSIYFFELPIYGKKGIYFNGKKIGYWIEGDETRGTLRGIYINGRKEGIWKYLKGTRYAEIPFVNDRREGTIKAFYPSGELESVNFARNDKFEGFGEVFYKSGSLKSRVNFINNKREGKGYVYSENGELEQIVTFENDVEIERIRA